MNAADSIDPAETAQMVSRWMPAGQLVPAEQPQPQEGRLQEERGQPLHRQRRAEDVPDQPRVRPPVHPELELLHDPGHHADRHVDHQQNAEEPGQPQVIITPGPVPRRLQQRGQERQPDRDRDEEEMIDRHKRELDPCQVDIRHRLPPTAVTWSTRIGAFGSRPDAPMIRVHAGPGPHPRRVVLVAPARCLLWSVLPALVRLQSPGQGEACGYGGGEHALVTYDSSSSGVTISSGCVARSRASR